jgi:hypothetical protein
MTTSSSVSAGVLYLALSSNSTDRVYTITGCTFEDLAILGSTVMISTYFTSFNFSNNKFINCSTTNGSVGVYLFFFLIYSFNILFYFIFDLGFEPW